MNNEETQDQYIPENAVKSIWEYLIKAPYPDECISRWRYCYRMRCWMPATMQVESLFKQCKNAAANNDRETLKNLLTQLEDLIDKKKLEMLRYVRVHVGGNPVDAAMLAVDRMVAEESEPKRECWWSKFLHLLTRRL